MVDGYSTATQAAICAALTAEPSVMELIGDRVVDEPGEDIAFPYVRFGRFTPVPDDTDGTRGSLVTVGLEVHSRPKAGRTEAARICEAINLALHKRPQNLAAEGYAVTECQVQTWFVERVGDGKTYLGRLSLEVRLEG